MKIKTKIVEQEIITFDTEEEVKLIRDALIYLKHRTLKHGKHIVRFDLLEEIIKEL